MQNPGTPSPSAPAPTATPKDHYVMAVISVISLILGIFGLLAWLLPFSALPIPMVALVLAVVGRQSSRRGMATAALVLSILGLSLGIASAAIITYLNVIDPLFQ